MSSQTKAINAFFRIALRDEVDGLLSKMVLTDRQYLIFEMKYLKGYDINYIADTLGSSRTSVQNELRTIRAKITKVLGL